LLGIAACTKNPATPVSPNSSAQASTSANPDGSTLKASPPTPLSPPNGQKLDQVLVDGVTLVVGNAVSKFNVGLPVAYRFEIFNSAGVKIEDSDFVVGGATTTSYTVRAALEGDQAYTWRARAEVDQGAYVGSWSERWSFIAPQTEGYIQGAELYDPLANGKTVGALSGPVTFVPGVGLRLESQLSYVAYQLPQTLTEGEFSLLVTDMPTNTDGDKTKLFAMAEGFSDIVTNNRRMTVEKRGDPAGIVAWRFISHGDQIDTEGAEREFVPFDPNKSYFWQATWRNNFFNVLIKEGGVDGRVIYSKGKPFKGRAYDPNPHVIYLGSPVGRSGESGASVDHVTIRQVWVSGRPRPAFANN
jgi:hypothetical protein